MAPFSDLRVVEGSAFVAAPLGGLTLAQLGADVIRFDTIGGGLDYRALAGHRRRRQPLLERAQQGKAVDRDQPGAARGSRAGDRAHHRARRERRPVPLQLPRERLALRRTPACPAPRPRVRERRRQPRRDHRGRLHGERGVGHRARHRSGRFVVAGEPRAPGVGHRHRPERGDRPARGGAATPRHRRGTAGEDLARRRRVHDGRQPRLPRPGADDPRQPAAARQRHVRRVRPRLPHQGRPARHGRRHQPQPVADARRARRTSRSTCRRWSVRSAPTSRAKRIGTARATPSPRCSRRGSKRTHSTRSAPRSTSTACVGGRTRRSRSCSTTTGGCRRRTRCSPTSTSPASARCARRRHPSGSRPIPPVAPLSAPLLGTHTDEVLADVLGMSSAEIGRLHDDGLVAGTA